MADDSFDPKRAQPVQQGGFDPARAVEPGAGFNAERAQPVRSSFWKDFGEGTGGITGLLTAPFVESIPAKGVKLAAAHPGEFAEELGKTLPATGFNPVFASAEAVGGMVMRRVEQFLASPDAKNLPEQARQAFSDTAKLAKQRPGLVIGSVLKGAIADPELFFLPGATEAAAGRGVTAALEGARGAQVAGAVVGKTTGVVTGAAIGGGASVLSDFAEDRPLNAGEAELGTILGGLAGGAAQVRGKAPKIRPMTAAEVEAHLAPAMETATGVPEPEVVPSSKGYLVRLKGQAEGQTFPTKAEADAAAKQLEQTAAGYRAMGTTPGRPWRKLLQDDPFNQENVIEKQGRDVKTAREDLVGFFRRAGVAGAIGAGLGYWLDKDEPLEGAAAGAAFTVLPKLLPRDERISAAPGINLRNGIIRVFARRMLGFKNSIETIVPEKMRREAISAFLEGNPVELNEAETRMAHEVRQFFDAMGNTAVDAGVVKQLLRNYVTHIVEADPEHVPRGTRPPGGSAAIVDGIVDILTGRGDRPAGSVASGRQFAKHRRYATFDELQKALRGSGLRIRTFDIAEISAIYGNAMFKAITDKRLLDALKRSPIPEKGMQPLIRPAEGLPKPGQPLIGEGKFRLPPEPPPGEAAQRFAARQRMMVQAVDKSDDKTYVPSDAKQLAGFVVHRDIAPQLKFIFNARDPNDWSIGAMALNQASKRAIVSFSLFHANSLSDAYIGAMGGKGVGDIAKLVTGQHAKTMVDAALAQFRYGGFNDGIDDLLMHGLELTSPDEFAKPEGMRPALARVAAVFDRYLPISPTTKAVNAISKFNDSLDHVTFTYLQTGYKLVTGLDAYERLLKKGVPRKAAATMAASYANDLYGSLDWFRVANDVGSRLGREAAYAFFNPRGRRIMQLLMFAPDWTFSTYRAAYKSLPGSVDDPALSALHRRYMLKSAIYYLTVANGINLVTAGHPIWKNENPTRILLKDGRTMQFSKHYMEPFEWLRDPRQTFLNKLAFIPRETFEELTGKEYLSAHDAAPTIKNRAEHIAAQFAPIPAQQGMGGGGSLSWFGVIGRPVYGKTPEQALEGRREKAIEKREQQKKRAAYYKRLHGQ